MNSPISGSACDSGTLATRLERLQRDGFVILQQCMDAHVIDQVGRELEPWFERTPRCIGDFYGWSTTRLASILLKSASSHALLLHPDVLTIMQQVLGGHCDWYQLNLSQAVRLHPGERAQIPHRDDDMWPVDKHGIEYMVNVMWPLSDFTAENGATRLWPRHSRDPDREPHDSDAIAARMRKGSALVYLGSVTHCGGSNDSAEPRTGLILSYCLGWLKPYENPFLAYPPRIARHFPPAVRDLLGYRIHRPNLGQYEGQDPSVIFKTGSRTLPMTDALPAPIAQRLQEYYGHGAP